MRGDGLVAGAIVVAAAVGFGLGYAQGADWESTPDISQLFRVGGVYLGGLLIPLAPAAVIAASGVAWRRLGLVALLIAVTLAILLGFLISAATSGASVSVADVAGGVVVLVFVAVGSLVGYAIGAVESMRVVGTVMVATALAYALGSAAGGPAAVLIASLLLPIIPAAILAASASGSRLAGSIVLIVAVTVAMVIGLLLANTYRLLAEPLEGYGAVSTLLGVFIVLAAVAIGTGVGHAVGRVRAERSQRREPSADSATEGVDDRT